jgi:hypothetical protein
MKANCLVMLVTLITSIAASAGHDVIAGDDLAKLQGTWLTNHSRQ